MEKFGKILVLVNAAFSVMLAAAAGVLVYNRIDWSNTAEGELPKRVERVKELQGVVRANETAWRAARNELLAKEDRRSQDQTWYATELARLEAPLADGKPVQQIKFTGEAEGKPTGYYVPDPKNHDLPTLVAVADRTNKPLQPMSYYRKEEEAVHQNLVMEMAALDAAKLLDAKLTLQLVGPKRLAEAMAALDAAQQQKAKETLQKLGDADKNVKGLVDRIEDEKAKRGTEEVKDGVTVYSGVIGEQKALEPLLVNTYVETQLLLQRKEALEKRLKDLKAAAAPK